MDEVWKMRSVREYIPLVLTLALVSTIVVIKSQRADRSSRLPAIASSSLSYSARDEHDSAVLPHGLNASDYSRSPIGSRLILKCAPAPAPQFPNDQAVQISESTATQAASGMFAPKKIGGVPSSGIPPDQNQGGEFADGLRPSRARRHSNEWPRLDYGHAAASPLPNGEQRNTNRNTNYGNTQSQSTQSQSWGRGLADRGATKPRLPSNQWPGLEQQYASATQLPSDQELELVEKPGTRYSQTEPQNSGNATDSFAPIDVRDMDYAEQLLRRTAGSSAGLPEVQASQVLPGHGLADDRPSISNHDLDQFLAKVCSSSITTSVQKLNWSLDDAINAALLYSHQVDSLRIEPLESYQEVGIEFGQFDTVSFFDALYDDSNSPVGNNFESDGNNDRIRGEEFTFNYGLRKELLSGGQIELSDQILTRDDDSGVLNPPNQARSTLSLSLTKELLRGSGRTIGGNQVLVAWLNAEVETYNSQAAIADLLQSVSEAYWNIFTARGALLAAIENAESASAILRDLLARRNIDADPNLVEQARVVALQQKVLADNAYADLTKAQFELVRLVNAPELLLNSAQIEIIPVMPILPSHDRPDVLSRQNTAIHNRPEVRQVIENIRRAQLEHHFSINQLLPRLAFTAAANFEGLAGDRDTSAAGRDRFDSNASYQVGANFEFPISNRQARHRKTQVELEMTQLSHQWKDAVEEVKRDVLDAAQDYATSQSVIDRQRRIFRASVERLNFLELRRYRIPKKDALPSLQLGQLLDVQTDVAGSKAEFVAAIANRGRSLINLNRATGVLVQAPAAGITSPGGNRFIQVYHQFREGDATYCQFINSTAQHVCDVSQKKCLGTWRGSDEILADQEAQCPSGYPGCSDCESGCPNGSQCPSRWPGGSQK